MATKTELNILAREVLHLIEKEGVPQKMAIMSVLRAHKDIKWDDGLMVEIGTEITALRQEQKKQDIEPKKPFSTFIEKSLKDD
jgi:hypothetical protein